MATFKKSEKLWESWKKLKSWRHLLKSHLSVLITLWKLLSHPQSATFEGAESYFCEACKSWIRTFQLFSTFYQLAQVTCVNSQLVQKVACNLPASNFPTFVNFRATCESCPRIAKIQLSNFFQLSGNLRKLPASRRNPTFQLCSTFGQLAKVARESPKSTLVAAERP